MYVYELPTTSAVSFSELCIDQSIDKGYTYCIPEATQARANLHALLKESKRTEHGAKDFLALVKILVHRGVFASPTRDHELRCS